VKLVGISAIPALISALAASAGIPSTYTKAAVWMHALLLNTASVLEKLA
jgi:hypothetical protein